MCFAFSGGVHGRCEGFTGRGHLVHFHMRTGSDGRAFAHAESDTDTYSYTVAHAYAGLRRSSKRRDAYEHRGRIFSGKLRRFDLGQEWDIYPDVRTVS